MKLKPFDGIGRAEADAVYNAVADGRFPLSGYLAGKERGGRNVVALEDAWATAFHVKHAIAVNSATSGLLAAAFAIGLKGGDRFAVSAMTMSATAAAPMFTGARPFFVDVEDETFGIDPSCEVPHDAPVFVTNLFGAPAELGRLRLDCDKRGTVLIEDNSQSPFAYVRNKYAGTIGDIGVFSLNVHKPIQCGEGGVVVTNDDVFAERIRRFINHGEVGGTEIGLNLRMPEVCAAIALVQLQRGDRLIEGRIEQAEAIRAAIPSIHGLRMPVETPGVRNAYYTIPFLIDRDRTEFCAALRAEGVPIVEGYVPPLYRLPAFKRWGRRCPMAESLHDRRLFYFENCAWDVSLEEAEQIGTAFQQAARMTL